MGIKVLLLHHTTSKKNMSAKLFVLTVAFIATFGLVQSAKIECNVMKTGEDEVPRDKSDTDGNALLEAKECDEGITMCKNMTVMDTDKKITGTKFACGEANKTKGCAVADGKQTCYCDGATTTECNKYTKANFYSSAVAITTPALLIFALVVSGFAFTS